MLSEIADASGSGPAGVNVDFGDDETPRRAMMMAVSADVPTGGNQDHGSLFSEPAGSGALCGVYDTCEMYGIKEVWTMVNTGRLCTA
jgi:hypothetical protein